MNNKDEIFAKLDEIVKTFEAAIDEVRASIHEDEREFVDLGLPSGTLWAADNEEGYYTFSEATERFGDNLPNIVQCAELVQYCKSEWDNERKGLVFTGPNGNCIFILASGYFSNGSADNVGACGYFWSSSAASSTSGLGLSFGASMVCPAFNYNRSSGLSVRLIKNPKL